MNVNTDDDFEVSDHLNCMSPKQNLDERRAWLLYGKNQAVNPLRYCKQSWLGTDVTLRNCSFAIG